jgi:hypothetical protein
MAGVMAVQPTMSGAASTMRWRTCSSSRRFIMASANSTSW